MIIVVDLLQCCLQFPDETDAVDANDLAERLTASIVERPRKLSTSSVELPPDDSEDEEETPDAKGTHIMILHI